MGSHSTGWRNQGSRSLEDLAPPDRKVCEFLSSLGVVFSTVELIKLEYSPKAPKSYIGTCLPLLYLYLFLLVHYVGLYSHVLLFSYVDMVLTIEKRRHLAEVALQRKVAPGPSVVDALAFANAPPTATSAPKHFCSSPCGS